jgi:hypothetical protein
MLIAWQTINAVRRPTSKRFTRGFLVVTPGLTIRDRLRVLQPNDPDSYYASRELVPGDLLNAFNARAAQRFITSLTFNQMGLTSFSYADLQDLRPRQAYAILSLFGAQDVTATIDFQAADETERLALQSLRPLIVMDYQNYRCAPPATCWANSFTICLSTCQVP